MKTDWAALCSWLGQRLVISLAAVVVLVVGFDRGLIKEGFCRGDLVVK